MGEHHQAGSGHRVFAALYGWLSQAIEAGPVGAARRSLLADARGVVADVGAGLGANLPHLGPAVTQVHLIEPDPHMLRRLGTRLPAHAQVHQAGAEHLPLPTAGVDTVLATLTLCTVQDPDAAVEEIRRILRPGGRLLILEHVRSLDPRRARWQDRSAGVWTRIGAGCHPNRDTAHLLTRAGFDTGALRRFGVPGMPLASEWVTGCLTPGAAPTRGGGDGSVGR
jgi:ubiquinone/menaquinone biosynthesis C-methylase UbiE